MRRRERLSYLRLYADSDGESRFEEVEVTMSPRAFAPPAGPIPVSEAEPVQALLFLTLPAGWDDVVHPSPRRQMLVCLAGRACVAASDGAARARSDAETSG
jgi:hypothetical protein